MKLLIAALLLAAGPAIAADALVTWPAPAYSNGTLIPPADVAFVTISWVTVPASPCPQGCTINTTSLPAKLVVHTPCGVYIFTGSYTTGPKALVPNATSNNAMKVYDSKVTCPSPRPPVSVTIGGG